MSSSVGVMMNGRNGLATACRANGATTMASSLFAAYLFLFASVAVAGCNRGPVGPPSLSSDRFTFSERNCSLAIEFGGKWVLVFEDVPARSVSVGSGGTLNLPGPPGSKGGSEAGFGDVKIKQSWDSQANQVSVNGHRFKLTDAGRKLEFADRTYETKERPRTIIIGKDDKTREEADK
jgi:hypothetical protein